MKDKRYICRYNVNKICEEDCVCDDDITEVTDYTKLKEALDFSVDKKLEEIEDD